MLCQKCGAIVPEGIQYCQCCGNDMFAQPTVSAKIDDEPTVIATPVPQVNCDEPTVSAYEQKTVYAQPAYQQPQPPKKKNKGVVIGFVVLSVVAVAAIVVAVLFGTGVIGGDKKEKETSGSEPAAQAVTQSVSQGEAALKIGDITVTEGQFDYYYAMAYQYFAQMEASYQQQGYSMGFPLDKAPDEVSSGQTDENGNELMYDQAVAQYAANLAFQQHLLYNEALDSGYILTVDEEKQIDDVIASLKEQASASNCSLNAFIRENYSEGLDEKGLRELLGIELIAARYNEDLIKKSYDSVTDEMVEAEYNSNRAAYSAYAGDSVDVRHCLIKFGDDVYGSATEEQKKAAHTKALAAKEEWIAAGSTEEAFVEIVKKYNDDTASNAAGGLYEGITANSNYVANFKNWAVDPTRKVGDCAIIETEYGYHLMYFVKNNGPEWRFAVKKELQEKAYNDAFEALAGEKGKYKMTKNEDVINECSKNFCDKIREKLAGY